MHLGWVWPELDYDNPTQVWWLYSGTWVETPDKRESVDEYYKLYIEPGLENRVPWGFTASGIVSVSETMDEVVVYYENTIGPRAGAGYLLTLRRDSAGNWQEVRSDMLWIS